MTGRELISKLLKIDNLDNEVYLISDNNKNYQLEDVNIAEWTFETLLNIKTNKNNHFKL